ncbi:MAG: MtrAB system accessory lipoprotein LpqB [Mycobacteriaceae bacterium]
MRFYQGIIAVCVVPLLLAGCATVPNDTKPRAIGTFDRAPVSTTVPVPKPGMEPELLVRDFLKASANPSNRHVAARQFLSDTAAKNWDDATSTTIIDKVDLLVLNRKSDRISIRLKAAKIGILSDKGVFESSTDDFESELEVVASNGEWRIDQLTAGVLIDRSQFLANYQLSSLYFLDPTGTTAVPDLRWVATNREALTSELVAMLIAGPNPALKIAVRNQLGAGVSLRGVPAKADGSSGPVGIGAGGVKIEFQGLSGVDRESRKLIAAQVVWTLSSADISGPFVLMADDQPLVEGYPGGWTQADVMSTDPSARENSKLGMYALRSGSLVSISDQVSNPVSGSLGGSALIVAAALSANGSAVAAVENVIEPESVEPRSSKRLMVGPVSGQAVEITRARSIIRPSWAPQESAIWTVVDGNKVIRVARDANGSMGFPGVVDTAEIAQFSAQIISELRLSRDGVRAAMIIEGKVVIASVVRGVDGRYALVNPRWLASAASNNAVSLDWVGSEKLVLVRSLADSPVIQLNIDGSGIEVLPSRNLSSPLATVVSSLNQKLVADARGVLSLSSSGGQVGQFWSEIPSLMLPGATPVSAG